jgi:hypothetical protein
VVLEKKEAIAEKYFVEGPPAALPLVDVGEALGPDVVTFDGGEDLVGEPCELRLGEGARGFGERSESVHLEAELALLPLRRSCLLSTLLLL